MVESLSEKSELVVNISFAAKGQHIFVNTDFFGGGTIMSVFQFLGSQYVGMCNPKQFTSFLWWWGHMFVQWPDPRSGAEVPYSTFLHPQASAVLVLA